MVLSPDRRFRLVNDYASEQGFVSGFPTFHEANYGRVVGGVVLLPATSAEWRDVARDTYGVYHIEDVPGLFRGAATYAAAEGYPGAFPNCHQQDHGAGVVYGTILIRPGAGQWRDVLRSTLGNPDIDDVGAMMGAASDYASAQGFAGGFPTFHQADHGAGVVYGVVLLEPDRAEWRDVAVEDLYLLNARDEPTCVVLCRFRANDGALTPATADRSFYDQYFFGRGSDGLRDYFFDVTHGRVQIVGDVFGWLDIGHTIAEHTAVQFQAQRIQAFNWGMEAARAAGHPVDSFTRHVVIINQDTDWGGVSKGRSMLLPHSAATAWSHSRTMHEYGHVLDLDDAFRTLIVAGGTATDTRYYDDHCVMSYATRGSRFNTTVAGVQMEAGPGLNGVYTDRLGGIPPARLVDVPAMGAAVTITLAPLAHADEDGALLLRIPPTLARPRTYWVELHDKSNWDRAIPSARIAVHETRPGDGGAYVLERQGGGQSLDSPTDPAMLTPDGSIGIRLAGFDGLSARVRIWELGPTRRQEVRISRVNFNPPGEDVDAEHVVIRNDRLTTAVLDGWSLSDTKSHPNSLQWTFRFPSFSLDPGEDVLIWTGSGKNDDHNLRWGLNHAVWNNRGGDEAVLFDDAGAVISRSSY